MNLGFTFYSNCGFPPSPQTDWHDVTVGRDLRVCADGEQKEKKPIVESLDFPRYSRVFPFGPSGVMLSNVYIPKRKPAQLLMLRTSKEKKSRLRTALFSSSRCSRPNMEGRRARRKKTPFVWSMRNKFTFLRNYIVLHSYTHIRTHTHRNFVLSHQKKFFHMTTPYLMKNFLLSPPNTGKFSFAINFHENWTIPEMGA